MQIPHSMLSLIGNTPLLAIKINQDQTIYAKLENFNVTNSVKIRPAYFMIKDGLDRHLIGHQTEVIEATSGNMGIALAFICQQYNLAFTAVMPESMSVERRALISAYGAKIILTPAAQGMTGAIEYVKKLAAEDQKYFVPSQFANFANVDAHYQTTGPEIVAALGHNIDALVCGIGSGGTISGLSKYFDQQKISIKVVGVEPSASPVLSQGHAGKHTIQGIGAGFQPEILNRDRLDDILTVSNEDALHAARLLATKHGVFVGISSGAAFHASVVYASMHPEAHSIVTVFPDTGERYLSVGIVG